TPGGARTPTGGATPGTPGAATAARLGARLGEQAGEGGRRRPDTLFTETARTEEGVLPAVQPGLVVAGYLATRGAAPGGPGAEPAAPRSTADSRPYGLPGGLGTVDPAHQAALEQRIPRQPDGAPVPHPDPAGRWPEALNGGGPREAGRANNGVDVALSAVDTLAGLPVCAAPRLPDGPAGERGGRDRAERELGTRFCDLGDGPGALARLAEALLRSGPGAQAVLLTLDGFGRSHTWNAVNHGDRVTYLDHQSGRSAAEPLYAADHGLWAIALDDRCHPLDLDALPGAAARTAADPAPASTEPTGPEAAAPEAAAPAATAPVRPAPERPAADPAPPEPAPPRSRLTVHRTTAGSPRR
ncbi:toxin glutamine deamidase domain-containing protein, partial [Kitasatospora paranensis]